MFLSLTMRWRLLIGLTGLLAAGWVALQAQESTGTVTVAPDGRSATVAARASRRALLAEIGRRAGFPITNLERVDDELVEIRIEDRSVVDVVRLLLKGDAADYIMTIDPRTWSPSRLIVSDKGRGPSIDPPRLAMSEPEPDPSFGDVTPDTIEPQPSTNPRERAARGAAGSAAAGGVPMPTPVPIPLPVPAPVTLDQAPVWTPLDTVPQVIPVPMTPRVFEIEGPKIIPVPPGAAPPQE